VATFKLRLLYSWYQLNRKLGKPQSKSLQTEILAPPRNRTPDVQPVTSRFTDSPILTHPLLEHYHHHHHHHHHLPYYVCPCHHDMVRSRVTDGGEGAQIWRVAVNILHKQPRTSEKGWSSSVVVGRGANNS
jgi:hypothetical protein